MIKRRWNEIISFIGIFFLFRTSCLIANAFPWDPPPNFVLNPKYIALHHPVKTVSLLSQLYFDQGLTFLYAFNRDAAYWSFLRASEQDPNMAMAYWGMAMALGPNINREINFKEGRAAYERIQKAIEKSENGPENEKEYVQALAQRYSKESDSDQKQLAFSYSQAMQKVFDRYPDDPDVAVLYAESLLDLNPWNQWSLDGKPDQGTMKAVKVLQGVLKKVPDHVGANHYFIHAVEASPFPEMALVSAERLKNLLPSSGHFLHMPSHIYLLVGDYEQAARYNLDAVAADREYVEAYGREGYYPMSYLPHNLYFLARAYTMQGRFEEAKHTADELVSCYQHAHSDLKKGLEYYAAYPLTVCMTFHRWNEILEIQEPEERKSLLSALSHFSRAFAFASLDQVPSAQKEQHLFLEIKQGVLSDPDFDSDRNRQILSIAEECLQAKLAESQKQFDQAIHFLKKAAEIQDQLRYNEPPDWLFPIRETLGGLLVRTQKPKEAEEVFRAELKRHPRNGRALFGLRESLKAQSRTYDAEWVNKEFKEAWRYSNISLNMNDL